MKTIVVEIDDATKVQLDAQRAKGYSLSGFVRRALALALARERRGPVTLTYRKPGGRWQRRTVPARQLDATILRLEDQGAEILTRRPA